MKYRIVDVIDNRYSVNRIEVRKQSLLDKLTGLGWWLEKSFNYNEDVKVYPHMNRETAIAEAEKLIAELKSGKPLVTDTVIKEI